MEKNDLIKLEITDLSAEGSGVGKANGMAVFVPQTAVGDIAEVKILKVKKNYAYAKAENIICPSKGRITPDCPVFGKCGGCALRHIDYKEELSFKSSRVEQTMRRIGGVSLSPKPILYGNALRYRNKAQYPVGEDGLGFYAARSHRIIVNEDCRLSPKEFSLAAKLFSEFIRDNAVSVYNEDTKKGLIRHFYLRKGFVTGEIQAVIVINGKTLPESEILVEKLKETLGEQLKSVVLNINRVHNNVILGNKNTVIYGREYINDVLCGVKVRLLPNSFYQVNHFAAELLYEKVREYADVSGKTVLDLYCGAGTIGLSLAKEAEKIIGVEIVPQAVEDAKENAKANGINNARFICLDAAKAAEKLKQENLQVQTVILDPPRKGCTEQLLKTVSEDFSPERIVYVSCDVATLARDVKILSRFGYEVKEYTPVDMFPRTAHVETVVLITRKEK